MDDNNKNKKTNQYYGEEDVPRQPEQYQRMDVVGGSNATSTEAPFYVALMERIGGPGGPFRFRKCGASLLSSRHVLTAAHCVHGRVGLLASGVEAVSVGTYQVDKYGSVTNGGTFFSLSEKYTIPSTFNSVTLEDDAAIITMKTAIPLADLKTKYPPVVLANTAIIDKTLVTVYGLGRLSERSTTQVEVLQKAETEFITGSSCVQYHGRELDPVNMVCAGYWQGKIDACNGDSGGPLVLSSSIGTSRTIQVGIVSWGKGCGKAWAPGVYTSIEYMHAWIEGETCPQISDEEKGIISLCSGETFGQGTSDLNPASPAPTPAPTPKPTRSPTSTKIPTSGVVIAAGTCIAKDKTCQTNGPACCASGQSCKPFVNSRGQVWFYACAY
ncbi:hypothetical protein ACA910_012977 [Epithemia clementina (nom. ined.)]